MLFFPAKWEKHPKKKKILQLRGKLFFFVQTGFKAHSKYCCININYFMVSEKCNYAFVGGS